MWWLLGGAGIGLASSYISAKAQNENIENSIANSERRYLMQSKVAEGQMEEQQGIARDKMTEASIAFIKARSTAKAVQAETGASGNTAQVKQFQLKTQEDKIKGQIKKEIDTNVINIAQGMIANKIDTEAMIDQALSQGFYGSGALANLISGGLSGGISGLTIGNALGSSSSGQSSK
jgi:hypothetical protein